MQADNLTVDGEEPPSGHPTQSLKSFKSAGRGFWHDVSAADWNDWRWQMKHRISTVEQLQKFLPTLTPEELAGAQLANHKLALGITPYFFNLIDPADENCPVRRQVVPRLEETHTAPWELSDPCGEDSHSPVPGLVHRYPDRVLFLVTDRCASYCRYCTRSRLVSNASGYDFHPEYDRQIAYIAAHPETFERAYPARQTYVEDGRPAWTVGHAPARADLPDARITAGFPDLGELTAQERREFRLYLIYPCQLINVLPDRTFWFCLQPDGPARTRFQAHILVRRDALEQPDYRQKMASEREFLVVVNDEDIAVNVMQQRGAATRSAAPGRFSHLEKALWQLADYVRERIGD